MTYIIAYDCGTTGIKTCLFEIGEDIGLIASAYGRYGLYILDNGGAEQNTEEFWQAMCTTTHELLEKADVTPEQIKGISFCSQMQGLVKGLIDKYSLPFVAYNQGSIVHLECTGAMSFDFSSMCMLKSVSGLLKRKKMMYIRKDSMERMGAAYMANGIVTLAGSRLYTSLADTPEIIDEALNRFEEVFKHVAKTEKGLLD